MKKNKCVGLIIKERSISAVEIETGKTGPILTNYSKILLEEGIVANGCIIVNKESFQEAIKKLFANGAGGPIKAEKLLVSIPEEQVFSHQIDIPKDRINDTEFIKDLAKDFIPVELNKTVFDYKIIHEDNDKKIATLSFVAAQNSIAEPIIAALKEVNMDISGMNVDINCLMRSFHNSLNQTNGDFMLLNLDLERDFLAIDSANDGITRIISKGEKKEMLKKIKALFGLSSQEEVQDFLIKKKEEGFDEEQKESIKVSFKPYLDDISAKIRQLISAAEVKEKIEFHTIYLTGILSGLPGIEEIISNTLPEVPIEKGVKYTEIPSEIETDALEGIGLCLEDRLPYDKNYFNLLPQKRKDEINLSKISSKIKLLSSLVALALIILGVQMSLVTAKNYLKYRITSQEVAIYNDQALNPYITHIAQIKQQTKQQNEQILSLINSALPVEYIIKDLNDYNENGVNMVNITYNQTSQLNTSDISLRAKTGDRTETESFIEKLENSPLYEAVDSPLSNLVGKGERFISVGLSIDEAKVIEAGQEKSITPANPTIHTTPTEDAVPTEEINEEIIPNENENNA